MPPPYLLLIDDGLSGVVVVVVILRVEASRSQGEVTVTCVAGSQDCISPRRAAVKIVYLALHSMYVQ